MGDVLEAVSARIKAPYFGYAVLAFVAWNWRALFLLVMTDGCPEQRLAVFDANTNLWRLYIAPILTGVFVAGTAEWIRFGFEWVARKPRYLRLMSVLREEHEKAIETLKFEVQRKEISEEKLIERAKREDQAVQEIESEEVRQRLQADLEKRRAEKDPTTEALESLDELEVEMLIAAAKGGDGSILKVEYLAGEVIQIANKSYGASSPRDIARYASALKSLLSKGLVEQKDTKGEYFKLTGMGWNIAEKLS